MAASERNAIYDADLDDSWVVNDSDNHGSSTKDHLDSSIKNHPDSSTKNHPDSSTKDHPSPPLEEPIKRQSTGRPRQATSARMTRRRRLARSTSAIPEPELIMPSIHEGEIEGSWINDMHGHNMAVPSGKRTSNTACSSSQIASRPNRRVSQTDQPPNPEQSHTSEGDDKRAANDRILDLLENSADWFLDVIGGAFNALRRPISCALAIYIFAGLLSWFGNLLMLPFYRALTPVCRVPGISMLGLSICQTPLPAGYEDSPNLPVEFEQVMHVQGQFEELLEAATAQFSLPADMRRAEIYLRDLRQVVHLSHLESKERMLLQFNGFIETARAVSNNIMKFNSRVGRGIDNLLATAHWSQRILDDIAIQDSSRDIIIAFVQDKLLAPFQPLKFTQSTLLRQYIRHMDVVSNEIQTLLAEAQALLYLLQELEERLESINAVALKNELLVQDQNDDILSQLWTLLGENSAKLGKMDSQLKVLSQVRGYRKTAWVHISRTTIRLQAMEAELDQLRERIGNATLLKDRKEIPLAVHLESIQLGAERLQKGRDASREAQHRYLDKVFNDGDKHNDMRLIVE